MLNWISSACIVLAGQAGPLYVNTKISMVQIMPRYKAAMGEIARCVCNLENFESSRGSSRDAVVRKSSSSILRSGAPKVLENTSKLEFSSFFIDYRLQLEHRGRTDESISENFEFE